MASGAAVGSVVELWRFPVKSMQGERIEAAELGRRGLVGDRAYALIDRDTGKVVSAKSVKLFPRVLDCAAAFVEEPRAGAAPPAVRIALPDGTSVTSDSRETDQVLSAFFGRAVTLSRTAPENFTIDMYLPDVEKADPRGRDQSVEQKLGSALFAQLGIDSPVPVGAFFDAFPLAVVTTSTLARLGELRPESRFDVRRFRMNVVVDTGGAGFVENEWVGRSLAIGDEVRVQVASHDARCVMTTLPQADLPRDVAVLRTLVEHNRLRVGGLGRSPCCGVYAVVQRGGSMRIGAPVALA